MNQKQILKIKSKAIAVILTSKDGQADVVKKYVALANREIVMLKKYQTKKSLNLQSFLLSQTATRIYSYIWRYA